MYSKKETPFYVTSPQRLFKASRPTAIYMDDPFLRLRMSSGIELGSHCKVGEHKTIHVSQSTR